VVSIANADSLGRQKDMISIDSTKNVVVFKDIIELFPEEDSEMTLDILLTDSTENVSWNPIKLKYSIVEPPEEEEEACITPKKP